MYRLLVGKPEAKRPVGRPRCRWVVIIRTNLVDGWGGVEWIGLAQDTYRWRALLNVVMNLRVPLNAEDLLSGCTTTGGLSSSTQLHRVR
jgi:hypothetical protein